MSCFPLVREGQQLVLILICLKMTHARVNILCCTWRQETYFICYPDKINNGSFIYGSVKVCLRKKGAKANQHKISIQLPTIIVCEEQICSVYMTVYFGCLTNNVPTKVKIKSMSLCDSLTNIPEHFV